MSTGYFVLRMLKRKRQRKILRNTEVQDNNLFYKSEVNISNYQNQCRICLKEGFQPIYGKEISFNLAEAIQVFGGIDISVSDGFPKHLCQSCYSLLKGAVLFRKVAQESNEILRKNSYYTVEANSDLDSNKGNCSPTSDIEENHNSISQNPKDIPKPKLFKCKSCKLQFKLWDDFVSHRNSKQHKSVRIQCPICNGLFTLSLYKRHLARHEWTTHMICEVCGKLYRKDNLVRHLQLHNFDLPYQCQYCPYRGRYMQSLKLHMQTHTGLKPFTCDKCNLNFLTRSNLNRHLLTHKQERPFKCVECTRAFYTKRDMDVHFKSDHAGVKDFECRLCGNKYGTRKGVTTHELKVHKRLKMARGRLPLYLQAEFSKSIV